MAKTQIMFMAGFSIAARHPEDPEDIGRAQAGQVGQEHQQSISQGLHALRAGA